MKKIVFIVMVISLMLSGCGTSLTMKPSVPEQPESSSSTAVEKEIGYAGAINENLDIHMNLKFQEDRITGSYYYGTVRIDLPLKGSVDATGRLNLIEYDANGEPTGTFTGMFVSADRIEGVWSNEKIRHLNKSRMLYPFYMTEQTVSGQDKTKTISSKNQALWDGEWNKIKSTDGTVQENVSIDISFATLNSFWFELHTRGQISRVSGIALFTEDGAVFTDSKGRKIDFRLRDGILTIDANKEILEDIVANFAGNYIRHETEVVPRTFKELGVFLTDAQERRFSVLVGEYYEQFSRAFQLTDEVAKDSSGVRVTIGYLRGLRSHTGGIIMVAPGDIMWAAVVVEDKVLYFTNDTNSVEPPETIRYWKPRDKEFLRIP